MDNTKTDLCELIRNIDRKKVLLPDFQREFVWKDEESQKKIVASVLAKMPIGSILLLKSKPDEYSSKMLGLKNKVNTEDIEGEIEYLLDGQQRITVLTNVFSNEIHDKCEKLTDLVSLSLKRRFFLRIPRWVNAKDREKDLFGIKDLQFPINNPEVEDPDFLSSDVLPFIECLSFRKDDEMPYNPAIKISPKLDTFCLSYEKGYLIPLYLITDIENINKNKIMLRYENIVEQTSKCIGEEIKDYYASLIDRKEKLKFLEDFLEINSYDDNDLKNIEDDFKVELEDRIKVWCIRIKKYLSMCVGQASLNRIIVSESQRARAIDIYENLNRGGISLNTFDLIMARVAKVSKKNFYKRIIDNIKKEKKYPDKVEPEHIQKILSRKLENEAYNASVQTKSYNEDKNEISNKYIDAFLDVLSLYCYNKEFEPDNFKLDNIKRDKILTISPEDIDANCENVCTAIDRALFFFQTRCGIRNIQDINYQLMLVLVATIFLQDENFENKKVHDILEAWYWASTFSGEYDKDQNVTMISHLQLMAKTMQDTEDTGWISKLKEYVLDAQNFSDESFLLLEKANEERYPKTVLRLLVCQYLLAKTYPDMFQSDMTISVFNQYSDKLEAHHIIPLGTVTKIGESTSELRKNPSNICNSPLNFVYITQEANKRISSDSLNDYVSKITVEAKTALYINSYKDANCDDGDVKVILKQRYVSLKGDIKNRITQLI